LQCYQHRATVYNGYQHSATDYNAYQHSTTDYNAINIVPQITVLSA